MNLINKPKSEIVNNRLSAVAPKENMLNLSTEGQQLKTRLKQKKNIIIYIVDDKLYVEHSAAYALGLVKVRSIMTSSSKLIEISHEVHNKLKNNPDIEIEYVKRTKKGKIKVYFDGTNYMIDNGSAYALNLIGVEQFNNLDSKYYYIDSSFFSKLKDDYDVEILVLSLQEEKNIDKHNFK